MLKKLLCALMIGAVIYVPVSGQVPLEGMPFWNSAELGVYSTGMVWRDANNDGYIDVYFSNGNDMNLARNTLYLSSYGNLPAAASWQSGNYEYSGHCAVGDIDDNGFADFIVSNYLGAGRFGTANYSNLYYNTDGLLSTWPDWYNADSIYSFSCALGDADGDGDLDLAISTGEGYTSVYLHDMILYNNDGQLETSPGWQTAYPSASLDVAWGDVNNDGYLDLAFCYDDHPAAVFYNNEGTVETTPSWQSNYNDPSNTLMFGDINADGCLDLIVADNNQLGGSGRFRVYFNDGAGNLDPEYGWQSVSGGYGSGLALYDFDHDGYDDLATGRWFDEIKIYQNVSGTLITYATWQTDIDMVTEELAWIDVDDNGTEGFSETFYAASGKKLFYTSRHPLQAVDSVLVDNAVLDISEYCYDLFSGWVSLADYPADSAVIFYKYSYTCDLTVVNWDTCNFAFANTSRPPVDIYADPAIGWAPLTVQFSDSSQSASNWLWVFSETDSSDIQNPVYEYTAGGMYDVYHENTQIDGRHNRLAKNMVIVLADTLAADNVEGLVDDTVEVAVRLTNILPVHTINLALEFGGPVDLRFLGYSVEGCRAEGFEHISYINYDGNNDRFYLNMVSGSAGEIAPGTGDLIRFRFEIQAGSVGDMNSLVMDGYNAYETQCLSYVMDYTPSLITGLISLPSCCVGLVGNVDCSEIDEPDISDITRLIDYLYISHESLCCPEEADANGSGGEPDISDITRLIDFLYLSHDPLVPCP